MKQRECNRFRPGIRIGRMAGRAERDATGGLLQQKLISRRAAQGRIRKHSDMRCERLEDSA